MSTSGVAPSLRFRLRMRMRIHDLLEELREREQRRTPPKQSRRQQPPTHGRKPPSRTREAICFVCERPIKTKRLDKILTFHEECLKKFLQSGTRLLDVVKAESTLAGYCGVCQKPCKHDTIVMHKRCFRSIEDLG